MTTTCWFCRRPLSGGETCPIVLVRAESPEERTIRLPGCPDCTSHYDAQLRGHSVATCGCWTVTLGLGAMALCVIGALTNLVAVASTAFVLIPVTVVVWLAEGRSIRKRDPYRPEGRLTDRAKEHPEVSELLGLGWQVKVPLPEPGA